MTYASGELHALLSNKLNGIKNDSMVLLGPQAADRHDGNDTVNRADTDGGGSSLKVILGCFLARQTGFSGMRAKQRPGTLAESLNGILLPNVLFLELHGGPGSPSGGTEINGWVLRSNDGNGGRQVIMSDPGVEVTA